jgi:hypothetical protein
LVSKDDGTGNREYVIRRNGTKVESYAWSGGTLSSVIQNTTTLSANTWYFVNWYFTSATKKMALRINDANEISTTLSTTAIDNAAAQFCLGTFNQAGNQYAGRLDEVCINAANFSAAERTDIYNAGAGRNYTYVSTIGAAAGGILIPPPRLPMAILAR